MIKIMFLKVSNEVGFSIIEFVLCDEVYIDVIVFMYAGIRLTKLLTRSDINVYHSTHTTWF